MTYAARLDAILARLTDLEKTSAMAHVRIQSSVDISNANEQNTFSLVFVGRTS